MSLKPTFLIIGGRRCGTNWLQQCLMEHPEIFVPPGRPGVEGFDDLAVEQYADEPAVGLVNAAWLTETDVPEQLAQRYPDSKLIAILRSPVDRAYSWYWQCLKQGDGVYESDPSFEEAMEADPSIIEEGHYVKYLQSFFRYFPEDQRCVLFFDLLKNDPAEYLRHVFSYLGVDPSFTPSVINEKVNYSTGLKSRSVHQVLRKLKAMVLKVSGDNLWLVHKLENSRVVEAARRMNEKGFPEMVQESRLRLEAEYAEDIDALESMMNVDLTHWK